MSKRPSLSGSGKPLRVLATHTVAFTDDAKEHDGDPSSPAKTARPSVAVDCIHDVGIQIIAEDGTALMACLTLTDAHRLAAWIRNNVPEYDPFLLEDPPPLM